MLWSIADNLKNLIQKIINVENFCQNEKFVIFVISFLEDSSKTISVVFYNL